MIKYDRYIQKRGYVIRKSALEASRLETLRRELTVAPYVLPDLAILQKPKSFKVYQENESKLYLPCFYGTEKFGLPEKDFLMEEEDRVSDRFVFHGTMRDAQTEVVAEFLRVVYENKTQHGGILQLPCGFGKTIIALFIASHLKVKTLIIVHKEFLLNQWVERIKQFLPHTNIGKIQQTTVDICDKDIVIGMLQSIVSKNYAEEIFSEFQLSIFDECHHLGAEIFSKVFRKINTKYMLGLSATPDRKDRLRKVFEWFIGNVIVERTAAASRQGQGLNCVLLKCHIFEEEDHYPRPYSPQERSAMVTYLCDSEKRNAFLMQELRNMYAEEERRILILSERKSQLEYFSRQCAMENMEHGFYVGGMKQKKLDESAQKKVILGTFQMASEGMDIPVLNTIILASPKSDVEQSVGRILRKKHECHPVVIDVRDVRYDNFMNQYRQRQRFYKKMGFSFTTESNALDLDEAVG